MKNFKTTDHLSAIMETELYKSGEAFTIKQMTEVCTKVRFTSRMRELLRVMVDDGALQTQGNHSNLVYRRSGSKWLRRKWVSEVAKDICIGDYCGNLTKNSARDAGASSGSPSVACQETR